MTQVSIIIPVYAVDPVQVQYLAECLDSVDQQADEIVVWDDGSPLDLTDAISGHNVVYQKGIHKGKSYARNQAIGLASHEVILPVDADDILASGAVETLLGQWDGTPLYSDLIKIYPNGVEEYVSLPTFSCEGITEKCLAAISVLHTKSQWETVGGWDITRNLYEDWLYNAILMWNYCGSKVPHPLLRYRKHSLQSTAVGSNGRLHDAWVSAKFAIQLYIKGDRPMACCGKRRDNPTGLRSRITPTNTMAASAIQPPAASTASLDLSTDVDDLAGLGDPGPGKVWALYVGGRGMGPHDRRGMSSRKKYQRMQYGTRVSVQAADTVTKDAFEKGQVNCGFIRLTQRPKPTAPRGEGQPPPSVPRPAAANRSIPKRPAIVARKPVESDDVDDHIELIKNMSIKELREWLYAAELDLEQLTDLKQAEIAGPNRIGAIKLIEKRIASKTSD